MDCLIKPYLKYFYSKIYEWKKKEEGEKYIAAIEVIESIDRLIDSINSQLKVELKHLSYFKSVFLIKGRHCIPNINSLYEAFLCCNECQLKCLNNENCPFLHIAPNFYTMCAFELFSEIEIRKVYGTWEDYYNTIPKDIKLFFIPLAPEIEAHLKTPREFISKQYVKKYDLKAYQNDNFLLVLKSMSSSSPWIYGYSTNQVFSGGGFFLKWHGIGIAIDPGYNFSANLHKMGYSVLDIDIIIITHNHIDHNHDARILDDLNKSCWKNTEHIIKWYIDKDTYDSSKFFLEDFTNINSCKKPNIIIVGHNHMSDRISKCILLKFFPTFHIETETGYSNSTFGVQIELYDENRKICTLSYTSDTKYDESLVENMKKSDIIIANISGIYEDDVKKANYKQRHLGYHGCVDLIEKLNEDLKLFLISEFWSGNDDIRFDISKYMKKELSKSVLKFQTKIFSADIGMTISLLDFSIKCSCCSNFSNNVFSIRPKNDFGQIEYICNNCLS